MAQGRDKLFELKTRDTLSKSRQVIKERITAAVLKIVDTIEFDIDSLEAKDKIAALCKLAPYVIPKVQEEAKDNVGLEIAADGKGASVFGNIGAYPTEA